MKAEIKKKWLEALRSGEYQQGRNVLRNEKNEMCCLGVLLDVTDRAGWGDLHPSGRYAHRSSNYAYDSLGASAVSKLGMNGRFESDPYSTEWTEACHIVARMNDGTDTLPAVGFTEIADWIEKNIPAE